MNYKIITQRGIFEGQLIVNALSHQSALDLYGKVNGNTDIRLEEVDIEVPSMFINCLIDTFTLNSMGIHLKDENKYVGTLDDISAAEWDDFAGITDEQASVNADQDLYPGNEAGAFDYLDEMIDDEFDRLLDMEEDI